MVMNNNTGIDPHTELLQKAEDRHFASLLSSTEKSIAESQRELQLGRIKSWAGGASAISGMFTGLASLPSSQKAIKALQPIFTLFAGGHKMALGFADHEYKKEKLDGISKFYANLQEKYNADGTPKLHINVTPS
jgi:hypothetical protein